MKKIFAGLMAAALLCSGTAALADDAAYSDSNNSVSVDASAYQTVLITKDGDTTDSGIVYVDQTASGTFGASAQFLIKEKPGYGTYTVKLGGAENGTPAELSFVIAEPVTPGNTEIEAAASFVEEGSADNFKTIGFGWEEVSAAEAQTVILQLGDKAYGWDFPTTITGGTANIGIKITDIPDAQYVEGAKAYLSSKSLEDIKVTE